MPAKVVIIIGPSGSGKTTSWEHIPENKSFFINADGKEFPFPGAGLRFSEDKQNYLCTSNLSIIKQTLTNISEQGKHIKVAAIDTLNGVMMDVEMDTNFRNRKAGNEAREKWMDLAAEVYDLLNHCNSLREDLIIYIMAHEDVVYDEAGAIIARRIKTNGRKLEKVVLESKATIVLFSQVRSTGPGENEHFFVTRTDGISTCKTPRGMFDSYEIPNDLKFVTKKIMDYYWPKEIKKEVKQS